MNIVYNRVVCALIILIFSANVHSQSLSLKTRRIVYEFLISIHDDDIPYIKCEAEPTILKPCKELIVNPDTHISEAKFSHIPTWHGHIIYLDNETITSIQKNFILSPAVKYKLLYKIGLLKTIKEKNTLRKTFLSKCAELSILLSMFCFEIAFISWITKFQHMTKLLSSIGAGMTLGSILFYILNQQTLKPIDRDQDLRDTIQKAHIYAKNILATL